MADYQKMYAILCGAVDDALMGLEQGSSAACIALRLRLALSARRRSIWRPVCARNGAAIRT